MMSLGERAIHPTVCTRRGGETPRRVRVTT
jgi:hypothetical protein